MDWRGYALRMLMPVLPVRELPRLLLAMAAGALVAGAYGIVHDQVTYSLGPEYFTRLKFDQFAWAATEGQGPRLFAAKIGFLATWWVGMLVVWILCRIALWREGRVPPAGELSRAFGLVFCVSLAAAFGGWIWGQWRRTMGYAEEWHSLMASLGVERPEEFMTVAYIHNASYLGGILGTLVAAAFLAVARRRRLGGGR